MTEPSNLRLLVLATLSYAEAPMTRYELMTKVNQAIEAIDTPYSPGAIYHEAKKLEREQVLNIHQDKMIDINQSGRELLRYTILEGQPPTSLVRTLVYLLGALSLGEGKSITTGIQRLKINMIKNNQIADSQAKILSGNKLAIKSWREIVSVYTEGYVSKILSHL